MNASDAARAAAMKRSASTGKSSTTKSSSAASGAKAGEKYYSGDSGIKVQPKTVLVISLVYMGVVLLLHIFGKLRGTTATIPTAE